MIQVDKGKLKFLKAGRTITVDVNREYRQGRPFTVRLEGSKTTRLRCMVLETFRMGDGCYRLTIKEDHSEQPRFLAADPAGMRSDYTHDPSRAARGELEPLDETTLNRYSAEGYATHARLKVLDLRRRHVRSATIRLREAERREDWEAYRKALADLQAIERMVA